jgi:hypothetical protein
VRRTEFFGLGFVLAAVALKVLVDSTPLAVIALIVGAALIAIGYSKRDEHEAPIDATTSLGLTLPETQPAALPSTIDVRLTPSSGPSPELTLAVINRTATREFSAQCTLLALRNSPNELSRKTFNLKWEHTVERSISIIEGESQNLLIATAHPDHEHGFSELKIWGLSANQPVQCEWSRWNLDSREALPEYDLEITIVSEGAEPFSERFTLRPRTWHGPLEMVGISG